MFTVVRSRGAARRQYSESRRKQLEDVPLFGPRVETTLVSRNWRRDALILQPQLPPALVVLLRRNLAGEHLPSPLVDQQPERQIVLGWGEQKSHERAFHRRGTVVVKAGGTMSRWWPNSSPTVSF